MQITQAHLTYWQAKKTGSPKWANSLKKPDNMPSIHALINSQTKETRDRDYVAHNTLTILVSSRKRGVMLEKLEGMAKNPGTLINPKRRAAYCRKWLKKIKEKARPLRLIL